MEVICQYSLAIPAQQVFKFRRFNSHPYKGEEQDQTKEQAPSYYARRRRKGSGMGARAGSIMVEKKNILPTKSEQRGGWKSIKVPEGLWHLIKTEAVKHRRLMYEELQSKYASH